MSRVRLVIADDEPIIRLDLRQMLESLGYEVVGEAGDGQEAVSLVRDLKPDVVILDVKMPVLDGIDAVNMITAEMLCPAILLTAYSDRELIERARDAGVFAYLVKPFKPSELSPAIEVARARFEQNVLLSKEVTDLADRLAARTAIDRAKGILMDEHKLTEAEAYRRIQLQSMNLRKSMREVAEAIILANSI